MPSEGVIEWRAEMPRWCGRLSFTGSRRSADKLIRRHYDDIYRFVAHQMRDKDDALDVTQDVFAAAIRALRPSTCGALRFERGSTASLPNKVVDWYRFRARSASLSIDEVEIDPADARDEYEELVDRSWSEDRARRAIELLLELEPRVQAVVRLRVFAGSSFAEIAQATQQGEAAAKAQYYRAVKTIRAVRTTGGAIMSKAEWREGLSCEERDRAIESILDVALPACETSRGRMRENLAALSLRALFFRMRTARFSGDHRPCWRGPYGVHDRTRAFGACGLYAGPLVLRDASGPCCMEESSRKRNNRLACGMSYDGPRAPCGPHAGVWGDGEFISPYRWPLPPGLRARTWSRFGGCCPLLRRASRFLGPSPFCFFGLARQGEHAGRLQGLSPCWCRLSPGCF